MKLIARLKDDQYPFSKNKETRDIVRALVLDENDNMAIHQIARDDIFGSQEYYETPGGGVDQDETLLEALSREIREEVGYEIEPICYLGEVIDFYNLIGRKNLNHYFLVRRKEFVGKHFVSEGDTMIKQTLWLPIGQVIDLYKGMPETGVSKLVKSRELPVILIGQKYLANTAQK